MTDEKVETVDVTEQAAVPVEEFMNQLTDVREEDVVKSIEIKESKDVFGDKAKKPDRLVVVVTTDKGARVTLGLPKGTNYIDGKFVVVDKVDAARSLRNKNSKMVQWIRKYGEAPRVGQKVYVYVNDNGFLDVEL